MSSSEELRPVCVICTNVIKTEEHITCSACKTAFHSACVEVPDSTPNPTWKCSICASLPTLALSSQLVLELQQLNEEIALERRFLRRKYELLRQHWDVQRVNINRLDRSDGSDMRGRNEQEADSPQHRRTESPNETVLQKMLARQAIPSDLPSFAGHPEDWQIFISSYKNSTEACGFSNVENLIRLQRSLTGPARQAVSSKLLLPECVPQVIATLNLLYGRPELLISSLIARVRKIEPPNGEDLNSLMLFGIAVQNLTDHLVVAGLQNHLTNPCLLQEMVDKLPAQWKLKWAFHKRTCNNVTLSTFSDFMADIVIAASQVTTNVIGLEDTGRDEDDSCEESSEINSSEVKYYPNGRNSRRKRRKCPICDESEHRIEYCHTFRSAEPAQRWNYVSVYRVCPCCLNSHSPWPCKTVKQCGVQGCVLKHHPLLHSKLYETVSQNSNRQNSQDKHKRELITRSDWNQSQ